MEPSKHELVIRLLQFLPHNILDKLKTHIELDEYAKSIHYQMIGIINNRKIAYAKSYINIRGETIHMSSDFTDAGQLFYLSNNCYGNDIWLPFEGIKDTIIIKTSDKFITNKALLNDPLNKEVHSFFRFINKNNFIVSMYLKGLKLQRNTSLTSVDSNDILINMIH